MKPYLTAIVLAAAAVSPAQGIEPFKTISIGTRPESVCRGFEGKLFVTVMNSQEKPGDGLVRMLLDGDKMTDFATGMDEPKGIAFVAGHLVVTDLKRVWKIDSTGKATVLAEGRAFPHPPSYLNDTAAAPDGKSVYVTDMGDNTRMMGPDGLWPVDSPEAKKISRIARVYRIGLDGKVELVIDTDPLMLNPNGVTSPEAGVLLVAEFFHGNILSHRDGAFKVLASGLRGADAIERGAKGELYISSWTQGKVWKLEPGGGNPEVIIQGLKSAADFFLDRKENVIILPDMLAGTLGFYRL
jgi:DNA-binding beta-propeller fold protein YncE